jgi:hypothetical protein
MRFAQDALHPDNDIVVVSGLSTVGNDIVSISDTYLFKPHIQRVVYASHTSHNFFKALSTLR